jgi:hypothetical protein
MSYRANACAIVITAVACLLLAPAAMASSGRVQVTGKQLKSALLPASDFLPGYVTIFANNSGGSPEHGATRFVPPMNCFIFWNSIGVDPGYGETAFADEMAGARPDAAIADGTFLQAIYRFASIHAAASLYGQISAKYQSCRTTKTHDVNGGTLRLTVHSRSSLRVAGHQALFIIEYLTDSQVAGPPLMTWWLWTLDGTNVYLMDSELLGVDSPQPTLPSLTLELIARVSALR